MFGRSGAWGCGASAIFAVGWAFDWIASQFQEVRTRTKEINGKLTELRATLEELKERV
jgi:hypothetical protein